MAEIETSAVTRGIHVGVMSQYVADQSQPGDGQWLFAYRITIRNDGEEPVQLVSRKWIITNAHGAVQNVEGAGVVGHQPRMRPGEGFQYVSACPLDTAVGTMHGFYQMVTDGGEHFDAEIPLFVLADPIAVN